METQWQPIKNWYPTWEYIPSQSTTAGDYQQRRCQVDSIGPLCGMLYLVTIISEGTSSKWQNSHFPECVRVVHVFVFFFTLPISSSNSVLISLPMVDYLTWHLFPFENGNMHIVKVPVTTWNTNNSLHWKCVKFYQMLRMWMPHCNKTCLVLSVNSCDKRICSEYLLLPPLAYSKTKCRSGYVRVSPVCLTLGGASVPILWSEYGRSWGLL